MKIGGLRPSLVALVPLRLSCSSPSGSNLVEWGAVEKVGRGRTWLQTCFPEWGENWGRSSRCWCCEKISSQKGWQQEVIVSVSSWLQRSDCRSPVLHQMGELSDGEFGSCLDIQAARGHCLQGAGLRHSVRVWRSLPLSKAQGTKQGPSPRETLALMQNNTWTQETETKKK